MFSFGGARGLGCTAFTTELVLPTAPRVRAHPSRLAHTVRASGELDSAMAAPPLSTSESRAQHRRAPFTQAQAPREQHCSIR